MERDRELDHHREQSRCLIRAQQQLGSKLPLGPNIRTGSAKEKTFGLPRSLVVAQSERGTSQRNILLLSALLKLLRFLGDLSCVFYAGCWSEFLKEIKTGWSFGVWSFLIRNLMFKTLGSFMTLLGSFSRGETSENLTIKRSLVFLCPMGCSLSFFKPDGFVQNRLL